MLIKDIGHLRTPDQIQILPKVGESLRALQVRFFLIVVTNQSGIARGLFTEDELFTVHSQIVQDLAAQGAVLDALYYCPHLPETDIPPYRVQCDCRKPEPGMLLRAEKDWGIDLKGSYLVGDTQRDVDAGRTAGVRSILLKDGSGDDNDVQTCADLAHAAAEILRQAKGK